MRIDISVQGERRKVFLTADQILRFLISDDPELEQQIVLENSKYVLLTDDHELAKAVTSITAYDAFPLTKLKKLLEVVSVESYFNKYHKQKPLMTQSQLELLREKALKGGINHAR